MRVLLLLVAFVATPFAVGVSQGKAAPPPFEDPANCGKHLRASDNAGRSVPAHGGIHGVMDLPCDASGGDVPPAGTAEISGRVYDNTPMAGRPGLQGWVVRLGGDASRSASTASDGSYAFPGLAAGNYWVCVDVQAGWVQQMPNNPAPCPNGMGYVFPVADGEVSPWTHFAMLPQ